jgi:hypothetical protein
MEEKEVQTVEEVPSKEEVKSTWRKLRNKSHAVIAGVIALGVGIAVLLGRKE